MALTSHSPITWSHEGENSNEEDVKPVTQLARSFSLTRTFSTLSTTVNPFLLDDSRLDPNSDGFVPRDWVKAMLHAFSEDPDKFPRHTAGVSWRNLGVYGFGESTDYQKSVINVFQHGALSAYSWLANRESKVRILQGFDGLVKSGETLLVLGRPGSGVSTLLKTIAGHTHGLNVDEASEFNYQGVPWGTMHSDFRGEVVYQAETDVHFPQLTVGETLLFAALARTPSSRISDVSRMTYAKHLRDAVMAMFGISRTINTKVGNEFVRGVSGGERKRVSIAEATLNQSAIQCWDNSTRGLDSATALGFVRTLRLATSLAGACAIVALYQASEPAYNEFDKVLLLYEGRQIYFGPRANAKQYFIDMGFACPPRQTTADFLTSLTSPNERTIAPGFERRVPRTPDQFADEWRMSQEKAALLRDIAGFENKYPTDGKQVDKWHTVKQSEKHRFMSKNSPFTISTPMQVRLCVTRGVQRILGDKTFFIVTVFGNLLMSLVLGSIYFDLSETAESMNSRCSVLFFAILFNGLSSALEILSLYAQRPIVEKQARYAMYRPLSEAISSIICDLPSKILSTLAFNVPLYFMANLRREADAFFIFLLFGFSTTLTMSMILRSIGQTSKTVHQALVPAAIFIIGLVIYVGFVLPTRYMKGWLRWLNYIDPIAYAYESLVINEFSGRTFPCAVLIPSGPMYDDVDTSSQTCQVAGAAPGELFIDGSFYIRAVYNYTKSHLWRNYGILVAFLIFFTFTYLFIAEVWASSPSKGEVLIFRKGRSLRSTKSADEETGSPSFEMRNHEIATEHNGTKAAVHPLNGDAADIAKLCWANVNYEIVIKGQTRRILNDVHGWVEPGKITALMGESGAGKTTLLDVLADRVTMGVVTGDIFVNGQPRSKSFQRTTGYVQQQDLHLETSTVREALRFSAALRQPTSVSTKDKYEYVEEVIALLEMDMYADAVIGVRGEGLNVEQRKRLSIGVELAAKPEALLFLDEPTSGLDSQTAWAISMLIKKLALHGQAILCTIHQPSAVLFHQFDRLLLLKRGGETVYFGNVGDGSSTMIKYFEKHGAEPCHADENPAEWMLRVVGAGSGPAAGQDWTEIWRASSEFSLVKEQLAAMMQLRPVAESPSRIDDTSYAESFLQQSKFCTMRVAEQYWRTPSYIYSKMTLCFITSLFIGLSFQDSPLSLQGLQNQMFSTFMLVVTCAFLVYQTMPGFVSQRSLYEGRERSSKIYSWQIFILANTVVEMMWNSLAAVAIYLPFYFLVGMYENGKITDTHHERGGLMFLLIWVFMVYEGTFAHLCVAGAPTAEVGATFALILFMMALVFAGVLVSYSLLPGFWTFMYRVSPMTYLIGAMLSTGVGLQDVHCDDIEFLTVQPPANSTCEEYIGPFIEMVGGSLQNPGANESCLYCPISSTDTFLATVDIYYDQRWRNFGLLWIYVLFNIFAALGAFWLFRVPKKGMFGLGKRNF